MTKLSDILTALGEYYIIKDKNVIEVILATVVGNNIIQRDPLWTMLVAASSGGKSSFMAPCVSIPTVHFIDDLTEKTFLSGYRVGKTEVSLLKIIGNGIMCFSDFTSIISKNPISKSEILAQFRLIYDGNFSKRTGTGEVKWSGKMGFLGASTPDIYFQLEQARAMGERFLFYHIVQPTDQDIVEKQETVHLSAREIVDNIKPLYKEYVENVRDFVFENDGIPDLNMTPEQQQRVHRAAMFCVLGKTSVHLDFKSGRPDAMPNTPGVGRDRKMFNTMLHALQIMNCYEKGDITLPVQDDHIAIVEKSAYSSINRERRKILEILANAHEPLTGSQIGNTANFGLQKEAVEKYLAPLFSVGVVKKDIKGTNAFKWYMDDVETKDFIKRVSGVEGYLPLEEIEETDDDFADWR